jgi:hypothetical protein
VETLKQTGSFQIHPNHKEWLWKKEQRQIMTSPLRHAKSMAPCPSVRVALVAKAEPAYYNRIKSNAILLVTVTAHLQCLSRIVSCVSLWNWRPSSQLAVLVVEPPAFSSWQPVLAMMIPITAAVIWGVFNVPNDPSRSGAAPVRVMGKMRLMVEGCFFVCGGYCLWRWNQIACYVYTGAVVLYYTTYYKRIQWLWKQ